MRDHDTVPYSLPDLPDEERIARARAGLRRALDLPEGTACAELLD